MKGLLLKDIYNLSGQLKVYACFPFLTAFLAYQNEQLDMIVFGGMFLIIFIIITAYAYDEMADFDSYALTLPLTKNDLVMSKYVLALLLYAVGILLSLCLGVIMLKLFPQRFSDADLSSFTWLVVMSVFSVNILVCLMLPLMFRFGSNKARLVIMMIFLFVGCLAYGLEPYMDSLFNPVFIERYGLYILPIASVLIGLLSVSASCRIMMKKEF